MSSFILLVALAENETNWPNGTQNNRLSKLSNLVLLPVSSEISASTSSIQTPENCEEGVVYCVASFFVGRPLFFFIIVLHLSQFACFQAGRKWRKLDKLLELACVVSKQLKQTRRKLNQYLRFTFFIFKDFFFWCVGLTSDN